MVIDGKLKKRKKAIGSWPLAKDAVLFPIASS
jgi:hypothetical protein